jgi:hypothetical protein
MTAGSPNQNRQNRAFTTQSAAVPARDRGKVVLRAPGGFGGLDEVAVIGAGASPEIPAACRCGEEGGRSPTGGSRAGRDWIGRWQWQEVADFNAWWTGGSGRGREVKGEMDGKLKARRDCFFLRGEAKTFGHSISIWEELGSQEGNHQRERGRAGPGRDQVMLSGLLFKPQSHQAGDAPLPWQQY